MPSLQEALQKAINEWTEPEDQQQEKHMSKSETIFNYIRDNKGCTAKNVIDAMYEQGIKVVTTETMIGQFIKVGMIVKDEVCQELFTKIDKYMPLLAFAKAHGTRLNKGKKKKAAIVKPKKEHAPGNLLPLPEVRREPEKDVRVIHWNIEILLRDISLQQAKALYVELHKYFKGTV